MNEHDKNPTNQTKEEEIGSLPEKESVIMMVKMAPKLKTKWRYRKIHIYTCGGFILIFGKTNTIM